MKTKMNIKMKTKMDIEIKMEMLKQLKNLKRFSQEKRALEEEIQKCRLKFIFVHTIFMFERPTTEAKLLDLLKRIPKNKCFFWDLKFYDFSLQDTDIYIVGERNKIFSNLEKIAKKIEMREECKMEGVGISFLPPGKFVADDFFNL